MFAESAAFDLAQELFGHDRVGVHVDAIQRRGNTGMSDKWLHFISLDRISSLVSCISGIARYEIRNTRYGYKYFLTSTNLPSMAAAATMMGLIKCVRPPGP